jgi:hypothetical protein
MQLGLTHYTLEYFYSYGMCVLSTLCDALSHVSLGDKDWIL